MRRAPFQPLALEKPLLVVADIDSFTWIARFFSEPTIENILSHDEQVRAGKYRFSRDRASFLIGRLLVRLLVSKLIDASPREIEFSYSRFGQPKIVSPSSAAAIQFSIAHSKEIIACAFFAHHRVGVDVEYTADPVLASLMESCLTPREIAAVLAASPQQRYELFYTYWTLKEAYLKALGTGLHVPMNRFSIELSTSSRHAHLIASSEKQLPASWPLATFRPLANYSLGLCVGMRRWAHQTLQVDWISACPRQLAVNGPVTSLHDFIKPP